MYFLVSQRHNPLIIDQYLPYSPLVVGVSFEGGVPLELAAEERSHPALAAR